jgi:hypothetical protein
MLQIEEAVVIAEGNWKSRDDNSWSSWEDGCWKWLRQP